MTPNQPAGTPHPPASRTTAAITASAAGPDTTPGMQSDRERMAGDLTDTLTHIRAARDEGRETVATVVPEYLRQFCDKRRHTSDFFATTSLGAYFRGPMEWSPSAAVFKGKDAFVTAFRSEVFRLYGPEHAEGVADQLSRNLVMETASHLWLPRRWNFMSKQEGPQSQPLLTQAQVLWAAVNNASGNRYAVYANTGRIQPRNNMNGTYFDLPALHAPVRIAPDRFKDTPETLIPAISAVKLDLIAGNLANIRWSAPNQYEFGREMLERFKLFGANGTAPGSFGDQVAAGHHLLMERLLPKNTVLPITVDSELVARRFMIAMLRDPNSITHRVFADPARFAAFTEQFANLGTGWKADAQYPFLGVRINAEGAPVVNAPKGMGPDGRATPNHYTGSHDPEALAILLEHGQILPKGSMKFFCLIADAGVCSVGGLAQSWYATDVRERLASFVATQFPEEADRARAIAEMPSRQAVLLPEWGYRIGNDSIRPLDAFDMLFERGMQLTAEDLSHIVRMTPADALVTAGPNLYMRRMELPSPLSYADLARIVDNVQKREVPRAV